VYTPNETAALKNVFLDGGASNIGERVYIKVTDDCSVAGFAWMAVDRFRLVGNIQKCFNQNPDIVATGITVNNTKDWGLFFADINGDGKADLINHSRLTGDVHVHYNLGSGFSAAPDKTYSALTSTSTTQSSSCRYRCRARRSTLERKTRSAKAHRPSTPLDPALSFSFYDQTVELKPICTIIQPGRNTRPN